MPLLQHPPATPEEIEASRPLDISPEEVLRFDEDEWYRRAYRGDHVPQLTKRALIMGTILGFFLSFTNVYVGLKTGWFLGVAITACILSYAIFTSLRALGLAKVDMTILENNCMQSTASSAGYATGNMVISAVPAMLLLSVTDTNPGGTQIRWPIMAMWVLCLAALGVFIAIPLKRNMINREKLAFPSGTAAAVTLQGLYGKSEEALKKARCLAITGLISALIPLLKDLNIRKIGVDPKSHKVLRDTLVPGQSDIFDWVGRVLPESWTDRMLHVGAKKLAFSDYGIKLDHSGVLAFAGLVIGFRVTLWMLVSALVLACVITPDALGAEWTNPMGHVVTAASVPQKAWKEIGIWYGASMLVAGGLVPLLAQWRVMLRAFSSIFAGKNAADARPSEGVDPAMVEVPFKWFAMGWGAAGFALVILARLTFDIPIHLGVLALVIAFVLALVAARATGETDITPGSAMGKIMQLTYGVLIPQSTSANLMTAAISANSSLAASDLLNDLKSGYLLGANPRRQFVAQAAGILTGTIASVLCYFILVPDATVLTGKDGRDPAFAAPAAQQWKAVAEVFKYGIENLHPMARHALLIGAITGTILSIIEVSVPRTWKKWVPSTTGVGLGLILPFFYPLSMFLGAVGGEIAKWVAPKWSERYLMAVFAGGVAGESILGVIVAGLNNFVLV